jgi:hypothetical protein
MSYAQKSNVRQELLDKYPVKETIVRGIGTSQEVVISGLIRNYNIGNDSKVIKLFSTNVFTGDTLQYSSVVSDSGTFVFDFLQDLSQDFTLQYGKSTHVFINPGDAIYLEFDPVKDETIFLGDNAGMNGLMSQYDKFRKTKEADTIKLAGIKRKSFEGYKKYRSKWYEMEKAFNTEFLAANATTPLFQKWITYQTDYGYAADLLGKVAKMSKDVSPEYYDFVYKFETDKQDALLSSAYQRFLSDFRGYVLETKAPPNKKVSGKPGTQTFNYLNDMLRGIAREVILTQYLSDVFDRNDYDEIMLYKFRYKTLLGNETCRAFIKKSYDIKDSIYKAASANAITPIVSTKEGKEILMGVREKYDGKVILLCFWTTTSDVCRLQLPYCKMLQERFKQDPFAVVYFCTGKNETVCKGFINEQKINGEHYFVNNLQLDFMNRSLGLSHSPYFVLVNKRGILANKDAENPGDDTTKSLNPKIIEEIEALLKK